MSNRPSPSLQAKCEEQAARISAVDLENLQLIDRLHALSTEFAQLQSVIKEQRDKNDDLQRYVPTRPSSILRWKSSRKATGQ